MLANTAREAYKLPEYPSHTTAKRKSASKRDTSFTYDSYTHTDLIGLLQYEKTFRLWIEVQL